MSRDRGKQLLGWLYRRRYVALHHFVLATTIAALMLAAEKNTYVKALDVTTRAILAMVHLAYATPPDAPGNNIAAGDRPPVLIVPNIMVQANLHGCGAGKFLAEIIRAVADRKPRLIALDLALASPAAPAEGALPIDDLTPANMAAEPMCQDAINVQQPPQEDGVSFGRAILDSVRYAAQTRRVPVVVRAPSLPQSAGEFRHLRAPVANGRLSGRLEDVSAWLKLDWLRETCGIPGVKVGSELDAFQSTYYAPSKPYLGNVAANVADEHVGSTMDVCKVFRPYFNRASTVITDARVFDRWGALQLVSSPEQIAIVDLHYYDTAAQYHGLLWKPDTTLASRLTAKALGANLAGRAVFIGDGNGVRQALTSQPVVDTDIQAAMFYSDLHRVFTLPPFLNFLFEVLLGTALGFLFSWSWGFVARGAQRTEQASIRDVWRKAAAFGLARLHLLWNLALLAGVIIGTFYLLDSVFAHGAWINPLPVILGMALKGLLNSRRLRHGHAPQSLTELVDMHPDVAWELPVIVVALTAVWILP